jgi:predicted AAA+ superfamily ATPase
MAFPSFQYISLEDLQNRAEAVDDPRGFLRRLEGMPGVILDEVQRAPDLFSYLQGFIDDRRGGPLILTGSQHFLLSERISQSLTGRVALLELMPLSVSELSRREALALDEIEADPLPEAAREKPPFALGDLLVQGTFPRIYDQRLEAWPWLDGYVRTYVERDVRSLTNVIDLQAFTRFVALCAGRCGQLLNSSSLASDAGVSHVTARRWISLLETSYVIHLLQPHHANFSKRLVKSPKLYFLDTGVLSYLLGIRSAADLRLHPLRGSIFECFILSELRKHFLHHGERPPLYFWRDTHGHEVDVIIDLGPRRVPLEIKAGETVMAEAFKSLDSYVALSESDAAGILVHAGEASYRRGRHLVRPWWACS